MLDLLELLFENPSFFFEMTLYRVPAVLIALTFHEVAHGDIANRLGDPTARNQGRLSLNPLVHLNWIGTLSMIFLGFGWAKPVPIDPNFLSKPRRDIFLISIAGVTVNFVLFVLFTVLGVLISRWMWTPDMAEILSLQGLMGANGFLMQRILYGYQEVVAPFIARPYLVPVLRLCVTFSIINLSLGLFNLLPIPPLDGWNAMNMLIFRGRLRLNGIVSQLVTLGMLALIFTGILNTGLSSAIYGIQNALLLLLERIGL